MARVSTNDFKAGMKIEVDGHPYVIITNQFVKPGKGQSFNRTRLKHLLDGRVIEKTFKSGITVEIADVLETQMRMIYREPEGVVFMDETTHEQTVVANDKIQNVDQWLLEDLVYDLIFYNGEAVAIEPPTFMEMKIEQTDPGVKGDTASGRVLKAAVTESGAKVQVPIFIDQGEIIKIDTRTGEYVCRAAK
ncbi:MAG: elongation factor P [Chlamydiales bacterium]|jgi:elongation factor P